MRISYPKAIRKFFNIFTKERIHAEDKKIMVKTKANFLSLSDATKAFEDESFLNGKAINPIVYAEKQESLVEKFQDEQSTILELTLMQTL